MKTLSIALALSMVLSVPAFAGGKSSSTAVAVSENHNRNNNNNSISNSIRDRLQAPGVGIGAAQCADSIGLSGPGFGIAFSGMTGICKKSMLMDMAGTAYGKPARQQVGCEQVSEFGNLPACTKYRKARSSGGGWGQKN